MYLDRKLGIMRYALCLRLRAAQGWPPIMHTSSHCLPRFAQGRVKPRILAALMTSISAVAALCGQSALLDLSSGTTGWTTSGTVSSLNTANSFTIADTYSTGNGSKPYTITPASGQNMLRIIPSGSGVDGPSAADSALGLTSGTI
jgi:hypothetical protein